MFPDTIYTCGVVFFSFVFYILWTIKVWSRSFFRRHTTLFQRRYDVVQHCTTSYWRWNDFVCLLGCTDYEGRILKSLQYKYLDEMENRRTYIVIFYFCFLIFFLLKWDFLLEPLCHTKRHGKYIFTNPPI